MVRNYFNEGVDFTPAQTAFVDDIYKYIFHHFFNEMYIYNVHNNTLMCSDEFTLLDTISNRFKMYNDIFRKEFLNSDDHRNNIYVGSHNGFDIERDYICKKFNISFAYKNSNELGLADNKLSWRTKLNYDAQTFCKSFTNLLTVEAALLYAKYEKIYVWQLSISAVYLLTRYFYLKGAESIDMTSKYIYDMDMIKSCINDCLDSNEYTLFNKVLSMIKSGKFKSVTEKKKTAKQNIKAYYNNRRPKSIDDFLKFADENCSMEDVINNICEYCKVSRRTVQNLKKEIGFNSRILKDYQDKMSDRVDAVESRLDVVESNVANVENNNAELLAEIAALKEKLSEQEHQMQIMQMQQQSVKNDIAQMQKVITDKDYQLKEKDAIINRLNLTIAELLNK